MKRFSFDEHYPNTPLSVAKHNRNALLNKECVNGVAPMFNLKFRGGPLEGQQQEWIEGQQPPIYYNHREPLSRLEFIDKLNNKAFEVGSPLKFHCYLLVVLRGNTAIYDYISYLNL